MLPGPDLILACPHCEARFRVPTLTSGNTFGARFWTDGYRDAPMLPRRPEIARCRGCDKFFWQADAPEVGRYDRYRQGSGSRDPALGRLPPAPELGVFDYYDAIEAGLGDTPSREQYLRTEAWWASNDACREAPDAPPGHAYVTAAREANMVRLLVLIEDSDYIGDRLMRAELHRELGEFDLALAELGAEPSPAAEAKYRDVTQKIRELAARGDRCVRRWA